MMLLNTSSNESRQGYSITGWLLSPGSFYQRLLVASVLALASSLWANVNQAAEPHWIWAGESDPNLESVGSFYFRTTFELSSPESGRIEITADNKYSLWINNERVGAGDQWNTIDRFDVSSKLLAGKNVVAVVAQNEGGPAGLVARVIMKNKGQPEATFSTGPGWNSAVTFQPGWWSLEFKDDKWKPVRVLGELGKTAPWGNTPVLAKEFAVATFEKRERPPGPFQLLDGDRVVWLGDTLIERAQAADYLETQLTARYPDRNISFRNLGWSADTVQGDSRAGFGTVADGYAQLTKRVFEAQPTVIFVGYGGASSSAGPAGIPAFQAGLTVLLNSLETTKAQIVILSPIRQEDLGRPLPIPTQFNEYRQLYSTVLKHEAQSRGLPFVDLFHLLGEGRPDATTDHLTDNGIHLTSYGYWKAASALEAGLGWTPQEWRVDIDANSKNVIPVGTKIDQVTWNPDGTMRFQLSDDRLPVPPPPGRANPSQAQVPGLARILTIKGLPAGLYSLQIDGQKVVEATAEVWSQGQLMPVSAAPEYQQVESLRKVIMAKNQLFFHRWRPQNETYLFGFRKHEQGNNAREIPMFDPLIQTREKEIAKLRQPTTHQYSLVRE